MLLWQSQLLQHGHHRQGRQRHCQRHPNLDVGDYARRYLVPLQRAQRQRQRHRRLLVLPRRRLLRTGHLARPPLLLAFGRCTNTDWITSTSLPSKAKTLEPLKAMTILRFATILTALIGSVSLSIAPPAFPQSDEDSTPSVWESDSIPPPPVADYLKLPPASATDSF